jgi:hypothetical protein
MVSNTKIIMSFSRWDTTSGRCERPKGVKDPRQIEPQGSICRETLRYAQSDMLRSISSKLDIHCSRQEKLPVNCPVYNHPIEMKELVKRGETLEEVEKVVGSFESCLQ